MANYFYLINEKNGHKYVDNERWWMGGQCFADILGKNGRAPLVKGHGQYYFDMGFKKYELTQQECKEIGELLKEKFELMKYTHKNEIKTDPHFAHQVRLGCSIGERLEKATENDKFIAYWQ
jgi:hypothetical protein